MTDTSDLKQALQSLASDVTEHVTYLRELGVSLVNTENLSLVKIPIDDKVQQASTRNKRLKPDAVKLALPPSLTRNANEAARRASLPSPPSPSSPLSPSSSLPSSPSLSSLPAPPAMRDRDTRVAVPEAPRASPSTSPSSIQSGNTVMPTKNNQGQTNNVKPPPQETLFGEIKPADTDSLPRTDETLEDIRRDIGDCTRCPLYAGRTQVVHSEGNTRARLMFVGEAPGADEDASGHPFVGRAGQLLNKIIEAIGMKREDVFIGNVNRCRPPQNRTPTSDEAKTCKPFLMREIAIVQPDVVVVLGNTALHNLLDTKEGITKVRGTFRDYKGVKVMPTFHPAYLLRDPSKKRETWEDMKTVRAYLQKNPRQTQQPEAQAQTELGLEQRDAK
ncbi:MAG: uracil-DNA glycosylase [Pyrinomonadaceae bacterium MAG19_C2-C3]|nr:uracil-DNA glycosylase [Pyrinomonadaceae bacterium MAG19_C2-C3]